MFIFLQRIRARFLIASFAFSVFAVLFLAAVAIAQGTGTWELGPRQFLNSARAAPPLSMRSTGRASLLRYGFVGRVGGVNFEEIAMPSPELAGQPISLDYDPARPDGNRLVVTVGGTDLATDLHDWQLIPIAEFAATEDTGVISLFGDGPDPDSYYYIQYHEAFEDTLLGLRLLQADITFIDLLYHWELPAWNGVVVLGAGESAPVETSAIGAAFTLSEILDGQSWQSWVLTDTETDPSFGTRDGRLVVEADPYYLFWDFDPRVEAANEPMVDEYDRVVSAINADIDTFNAKAAEQEQLIDQYNVKVAEYNATNDSNRITVLDAQLNSLGTRIDRLDAEMAVLEEQIDDADRRLEALVAEMEARPVRELTELTETVRANEAALEIYNPAVYLSYQRTARYAALFRYVKSNFNGAWRRFLDEVRTVTIAPAVETPTAWAKN